MARSTCFDLAAAAGPLVADGAQTDLLGRLSLGRRAVGPTFGLAYAFRRRNAATADPHSKIAADSSTAPCIPAVGSVETNIADRFRLPGPEKDRPPWQQPWPMAS
jgi:hypothetical protein